MCQKVTGDTFRALQNEKCFAKNHRDKGDCAFVPHKGGNRVLL